MRSIVLVIALLCSQISFSQTRSNIFHDVVKVNWLGLDFTQVNFIGAASQWQEVGDITSAELRDKYFLAWNELFISESDKYDLASAVRRPHVNYKTDVTATSNNKSDRDYFVNDPGEFRHLDKNEIVEFMKNYDFKENKGLGMLFIVEGMHKEIKKASMWCVFVNMESKEVLLAKRIEGKTGGIGFRNYWAKSFYNGVKEVEDQFLKWKKNK